jgi:hypothetical protein
MPWIDPGEFVRGAAAREDARADRERAVLDQLLSVGWNRRTAAEARRLHQASREAVANWMTRCSAGQCDETALGLVGEARGAAFADWWAEAHGLDDQTRRLLRECASAVAAMAMTDGYLLGCEDMQAESRTHALPAPARTSAPVALHTDGARPAAAVDGARVNAAGVAAGAA